MSDVEVGQNTPDAKECQRCFLLPEEERVAAIGNCSVLAALAKRNMKPPTEEAMYFMLAQPPDVAIPLVALKQSLAEVTNDVITPEVAYSRLRTAKRIASESFGDKVFTLSGSQRDRVQVFNRGALTDWCEAAAPPQPEPEQAPDQKRIRLPASFQGKKGVPGIQAMVYSYIMKGSSDMDEATAQDEALAEMLLNTELDPVVVHISIFKALKQILSSDVIDRYAKNDAAQDRFAFAAQLAERLTRNSKREA